MITEYLTNPPVAVVTGGGVAITNIFIAALPVAVNILMAIYLTFLIVHKGIQVYREFKNRNEPTE